MKTQCRIIPILILILILNISGFSLYGEDILITFTGSGASTSITSVIVENLTRTEKKTLNGTDILRLTAINTGIEDVLIKRSDRIRFYPNPMKENSLMEFNLPLAGKVEITLTDISGRIIFLEENYLQKGSHSFRIKGIDRGIYIASVKSGGYLRSGKLISECMNSGEVKISYEENSAFPEKETARKGSSEEVVMQYTPGDNFKFTAVSGNYSTVLTTIPSGNTALTFDFITCTDGEGNNYPTLKIGSQVWMAENLKTTKYNDGTAIPYVVDNFAWMILETPSYSWFNHDINNKNIYGALYNWYTVNTGKLCPAGWHAPSDTDWTTLINHLGGFSLASGKMKERGNIHWKTENTDATNESGFTVLPAGAREYDGVFQNFSLGYTSYFWSTASNLPYHAWHIALFTNGPVTTNWVSPMFGFSVRCLKN